jgi:hypothetical protein
MTMSKGPSGPAKSPSSPTAAKTPSPRTAPSTPPPKPATAPNPVTKPPTAASTPSPKPAATTPNPISHHPSKQTTSGGQPRRIETSEMTISKANLSNPRNTPAGAAADRATRSVSKGTGQDAAHRHSLSTNADPKDAKNVFIGNSMQNRAGGTKSLVEQRRNATLRQDDSKSLSERSDLIYSPNRAGYGNNKPIAEKVTHTWSKDGKTTGQNAVYFGNFSSSSSRYADGQKAAGKTVDAATVRNLNQQDRANAKAQGHGTAAQSLRNAEQLRSEPGVKPPPAIVADKRSAAKQMMEQARSQKRTGPTQEQTKPPRLPSK